MLNSKLIKVISHLSLNELDNLTLKLQHAETNVAKLFNYILPFSESKFTANELTKTIVFQSIFPNQKYSETRILKTMSELTKLIEQEIIESAQKNDIIFQKISLLKFYLQHGLDNLFDIEHKEIMVLLNKMPEHINLYYTKYIVEEIYIERNLKEKYRGTDYAQLYQQLNDFYLLADLRIQNLVLTSLKNNLPQHQTNTILFIIYKKINELLVNDVHADFVSTFNLIADNAHKIRVDELRTMSIFLINYCIVKNNQNQPNFKQYTFEMYQFQIAQNIILEASNCILPSAYKNIITLGLRLGKIDYVKEFIANYTHFLPIEKRQETYNYNNAYLLFYEKKYEKSLEMLISYSFNDIFYKIGTKRLQIMCYYMLLQHNNTYFDILENALNSFKKYIYTNKEISEHYKKNDIEFMKIMNKLFKPNTSKLYYVKLKNELALIKQIAEYDWLHEIIEMKIKP